MTSLSKFVSVGRLLILTLALSLVLNCSNRSDQNAQVSNSQDKAPANGLELIRQREVRSQTKPTDQLGNHVSTIDFRVRATEEESKEFSDGIIPWIGLDEPRKEIDRLLDGDRIVIPYKDVTLIIDYPLGNSTSADLRTGREGFSRKSLVSEISRIYKEIYAEEEKTATIITVPRDQRKGLINRNETNGKYAIWGHDLSDLALSLVEVYRSPDGKIVLSLTIES